MGDILVGFESVAVDSYSAGNDFEFVERTVHCQYGGIENINAVNLAVVTRRYSPSHSVALDDRAEKFPLTGRQFF